MSSRKSSQRISRQYAEVYVARMLYWAPEWIITSFVNEVAYITVTDTGFEVRCNPKKKKIDSLYPKVKQWVEGYVAVTPYGEPSSVQDGRLITIH